MQLAREKGEIILKAYFLLWLEELTRKYIKSRILDRTQEFTFIKS